MEREQKRHSNLRNADVGALYGGPFRVVRTGDVYHVLHLGGKDTVWVSPPPLHSEAGEIGLAAKKLLKCWKWAPQEFWLIAHHIFMSLIHLWAFIPALI